MAKKTQSSKAPTESRPTYKAATHAEFKKFLKSHVSQCEIEGGGGSVPSFPAYDLMPQDYLTYAAEALSAPTNANKINCIAHLKRAAECQADTLLHVLSLSKRSQTNNFPSKMDTVASLDLMPSRSIAKLNRVRNKMEH